MTDITRYKEVDPDAGMYPSSRGFYVEYPDHLMEMNIKDAEIDRLTALVKRLEARLVNSTELTPDVIDELWSRDGR